MTTALLINFLTSSEAIGFYLFILSEIIGQMPIPPNGVLAFIFVVFKGVILKFKNKSLPGSHNDQN